MQKLTHLNLNLHIPQQLAERYAEYCRDSGVKKHKCLEFALRDYLDRVEALRQREESSNGKLPVLSQEL